MSLFTYVMNILMSLMMLSMIFVMVTMARASADRIAEVLEEKADLTSPPAARTQVEDGRVDFDHVSFSYKKSGKPVLDDIDLHIRAGETIGIIGGTGSAKSTLVQLIPRLYDVDGRRGARGRRGCAGIRPGNAAQRGGHGAAEKRALLRHDPRKTCAGATRTPRTRRFEAPADWPRPTNLSARFPKVMTPISSRAAPMCPAGRNSACASPARC